MKFFAKSIETIENHPKGKHSIKIELVSAGSFDGFDDLFNAFLNGKPVELKPCTSDSVKQSAPERPRQTVDNPPNPIM